VAVVVMVVVVVADVPDHLTFEEMPKAIGLTTCSMDPDVVE